METFHLLRPGSQVAELEDAAGSEDFEGQSRELHPSPQPPLPPLRTWAIGGLGLAACMAAAGYVFASGGTQSTLGESSNLQRAVSLAGDAKEPRPLLLSEKGCFQISREDCCLYADGRHYLPEYTGQTCVPAMEGHTFSSGNTCEPTCWVKGECGDGEEQGHLVGKCKEASAIKWKAQTEMCLDVLGNDAGAALQLWRCSDLKGADATHEDDLKWLAPEGQTGYIRWHKNTNLCLDNPEHDKIQLWYCDKSPKNNINWTVGEDGRIHKANEPGKCIDLKTDFIKIPPTKNDELDGIKMQLVECSEAKPNGELDSQQFDFGKYDFGPAKPVNCKWGDWSHWSVCSASCGGGKRFASRRHETQAEPGGEACVGPSSRSSPEACNTEDCPKEDDEPKAEKSTTTAKPTTSKQGGGGGGFWMR